MSSNDLNAKAQKHLDEMAAKEIGETITLALAEEGYRVSRGDISVKRRSDGRFAVGLIVEEQP